MPQIRSTYPSGGSLTEVSGAGSDLSPLMALLRRSRPQAAEARPAYRPAAAPVAPAAPPREDDASDTLRRAQTRDALIQMRSRQGTAPSKYVTVAGQTFLTQDPDAMNAYQRQAFLPQSAGMQSGGGSAGGSGGGGLSMRIPGVGDRGSFDSDGPAVMGATNIGSDPTEVYRRSLQDEAETKAEDERAAERAQRLRLAMMGRG